jgi:hypothetical protein
MPQVTHSAGNVLPSGACSLRARAGGGRLLLSLCAVLSCKQVNTLEGSLGEILDLEFTGVEVSITEKAVIVGYWRPKGEGRDIVFKLVAYKVWSEVVPGESIDLGPAPDGAVQAAASRSAADDPVRTYAAIKSGALTLSTAPAIDQPLSGEFRVTLGEGGDAGKGRTAFGKFEVDRVVPGN